MLNSMKKWVWFDLDDTLHNFIAASKIATSAVLAKLSSQGTLPLQIVEKNYSEALKKHSIIEFSDGRTSKEYRTERFLRALGYASIPNQEVSTLIEEALSEYETKFMSNLTLKPHAKEVLLTLRDAGTKLAILTDAPADAQERVLGKLGLLQYFDAVFTSGAGRVSKRNGLFSKALTQLAINASDVVMIGNSLASDVNPAKALGIEAVWFNDIGATNTEDHFAISSLKELLDHPMIVRISNSSESIN